MNAVQESSSVAPSIHQREIQGFEVPVDVRTAATAARFLGVSPSLVYAYVERKQIPHFRMMGRAIRFRISELEKWRHKFFFTGVSDEQDRKTT